MRTYMLKYTNRYIIYVWVYTCVCVYRYIQKETSQLVLVVKNLPANAGDVKDAGSIPGLRRSPGGGHGNPFQYSCLENPMDRGA